MFLLCMIGCAGSEPPGGTPGQAGAAAGAGGSAGTGANAGASGTAGDSGGAGTTGVAGATGVAGSGVAGAAGTGVAGAVGTGGAAAGGRGGSAGGATGGGGAAGAAGRGGGSGAPGGTSGGPAGAGGQQACPGAAYNSAQPPAIVTLTGSLGTHDPMVIVAGSRYYLFNTGRGVGTKTSTNVTSWTGGGAVFGSNPGWIAQQVSGASDLWAPDVSYFGGSYHLYYSASTFGSNHSCIGHATRAALDSGSWADQGSVVCSNATGSNDNWNAIDPNVVIDDAGVPWLSFGSFWGGLKMVKLTEAGARADTMLYSIAARPSAGGALEAPFVFKRCGYYYLFMSWDRCCNGASSTYNIRVGRSTTVTGPYVDKAGTQLMMGGGTLLVQGDTRWKGPGHNAVFVSGNTTYNVYHSYDANNNGASMLRISELVWDADGWPVSAGP